MSARVISPEARSADPAALPGRRQSPWPPAATAVGVGLDRLSRAGGKPIPPVAARASLPVCPARQHAWTATLARDSDGNPIAPRFDRLLFFDVAGDPTPAHARRARGGAADARARLPWGPSGLLFTAGWGPGYFERSLRVAVADPARKGLSDFELPAIDDYDLCLHLACDDERRLAAIEAALLHGTLRCAAPTARSTSRARCAGARREPASPAPGCRPHTRTSAGSRRATPFRDRAAVHGLQVRPAPQPGDRGRRHDPSGPFAGGTTMQVSYMRLRLDSWYRNLTERERVARMYAPQVTPAQVAHFTTDAEQRPEPARTRRSTATASIGHAQTSARARRNGKPLIIRRDFNTVDGGQAGLHFVSVQRTIEDFITTRNAMNASVGPTPEPEHHRHRQQRHQRVHLRRSSAPTTSSPPAPTARSRCSPAVWCEAGVAGSGREPALATGPRCLSPAQEVGLPTERTRVPGENVGAIAVHAGRELGVEQQRPGGSYSEKYGSAPQPTSRSPSRVVWALPCDGAVSASGWL